MHLLTPDEALLYTPELCELLSRDAGATHGEFTALDLLRAITDGRLSAFVPALNNVSAVAVVDIVESFRIRAAFVLFLAGDAEAICKDIGIFEEWARLMSCSEVRMACSGEARERLFGRRGFKKLYSVCSYRL